jgi:hypothetical protein
VIANDLDLIHGHCAANVDANSIFADSYIFIFLGKAVAFALKSECIAGENAAEHLNLSSDKIFHQEHKGNTKKKIIL